MKFSLLLFCFFALYGNCQTPSFQFNMISQNEGLLESTNAFIYKDSKGLIWISSLDGLHRFDGKQFKIFRADMTNPQSVYGNNIQSRFFETKNGNIWFATEDAINCYQRETGNFKHYFIQRNFIPNSREQYYIFYLEQERYLWVKADNFLYRFDTYLPENNPQKMHPFHAMRCSVLCRKDGKVKRLYGCFWDLKPGLEIIDYDKNYQIDKKKLCFQ